MYLHPGDILYLSKGEKSPVDAMILSTAYEDGTCFVETAELDGWVFKFKSKRPLTRHNAKGDKFKEENSFE
jgi:magnesium-transporting ATPase (P-type)